MKKTVICSIVFVFCISMLMSVCGKSKTEKIYGTVISLDASKNEVVIKDDATGKERTVVASNPTEVAALKPDIEIKAKLTPGTNTAQKIKPHIKKQKPESDEE